MINIGIMIDYHSAFNNNNNIIAFICDSVLRY